MVGANRERRAEGILRLRSMMQSSFSKTSDVMRCRDHFTVVKRSRRPFWIAGESAIS